MREIVESDRFAEAFEKEQLKRWPLAVAPPALLQSLRKEVDVKAQTVVYKVEPGKLKRKHEKVRLGQMRMLQTALDRGEVIWEKPGRKKQAGRNTLLAHYQDDKGVWWRYAVRVDPHDLSLITVFDNSTGQARQAVLKRKHIEILRDWDAARWRNEK